MVKHKENRLIVADSGWAETIPEWILKEIEAERMINGMVNIAGNNQIEDWEMVGNAEVVAYLYTHSLRASMSSEFTKIYLYLTTKLMKDKKGVDIPSDINTKKLTEQEESVLKILRQDIARVRGKINHPLFDILNELKKGK